MDQIPKNIRNKVKRGAQYILDHTVPGRLEVNEPEEETKNEDAPEALLSPKNFDPSPRLLDFIAAWEGFRREAYQDVGGVWTVGYGFTQLDGRPVQPQDSITKKQARIQLAQKVDGFARGVGKMLPGSARYRKYELDALTSLAYNIGLEAFKTSTLRRKLMQFDYGSDRALNFEQKKEIAMEFKRWNKVHGEEVQGLTNRRQAEVNIFMLSRYDT